jgi:hypothetical protein
MNLNSHSFNHTPSTTPQLTGIKPGPDFDHLSRIFNTALISSAADLSQDHSQELFQLSRSPAFRSILKASEELARDQACTEKEAIEALIHVFRRMDQIWQQCVYKQGLERLKTSK